MGLSVFEPLIVSRVPETLSPNTLYLCFDCNVVVHSCACGCGESVVLPIHPDFWRITYDGEHATLYPSIGNFNFPCNSHYWIKENKVLWASNLSAPPSPPKPITIRQRWAKAKLFLRNLFGKMY